MNCGGVIIPLCVLAGAASVRAGEPALPPAYMTVSDASGDARLRRTDLDANGPIEMPIVQGRTGNIPDVISVRWGGWNLDWHGGIPYIDPYDGDFTSSGSPSIVRIDITFRGLVNPPGPLEAGGDYFPYLFGNSPVYGSLDIDLDANANTGGELGAAALSHYLAVTPRFGEMPQYPEILRTPFSGAQIDLNLATAPQYERSGAEFSLTMCGCFTPTIVDTNGDNDGVFGPGDKWIVRGRFFRRAGGLQNFSAAIGGSEPGAYDPLVNLRFSHSTCTNTTTVTLVYPITQQGAAKLRCWNCAPQPKNLDVSDDTSIDEAMADICDGALDPFLQFQFPETNVLAGGWGLAASGNALDPRKWRLRAAFATAYSTPQPDAHLAWTDVAFGEKFADFNGDASVTATDRALLTNFVWSTDGTGFDCDGLPGGRVTICSFGPNFSAFDLNYDGRVDAADAVLITPVLLGDFNGDCAVNTPDLVFFLGRFGQTPNATVLTGDLNGDGIVDTFDLTRFLGRFGSSCQ